MIFKAKTYDECHCSRLLKMENAIINYSGGIHNLEMRTRHEFMKLEGSESDLALLLNDYLSYLRDVALAGQLENNVYYLKDTQKN